MNRSKKAIALFVVAAAFGGICFQCNALGSVGGFLADFNPCGTILACDPAVYSFLNSGIDGPGVAADIDPFCTYPPFCNGTEDPIYGGILGGG